MIVRYAHRARRDLETILDYIEARSPAGARNVWRSLTRTIDGLASASESGLATKMPAIRVKILTDYPFKIFYRVRKNDLEILHIRHSARRPWRGA